MFSLPDSHDIVLLHGEHSSSLVIISILIACCAAYTALSMNQRIQSSSFFHKNFWLILASIAMGMGIWSMHFIGMSAFMLPVTMEYDWLVTSISVLPAILASYLAFYVANQANIKHRSYILAGLIMGLGISSMHYIGMSAMKMEAKYVYKPGIFLASVLIAVVASYVALYVFSTLQKYMNNQWIKIITSTLLGLAIASMHYTGMYAVVFYMDGPVSDIHHMHKMDTSLLIIVVTLGIALLLLISGLTSLLDRYVDNRFRYFDGITMLPNQRQFEQDLDHHTVTGSLAILHIHHLEKWVTSYGYTFGDKIVKAVAEIIQQESPSNVTIYRIEGNRFALSHFGKAEAEAIRKSLREILQVLEKPQLIDQQEIVIEAVCALAHSDQKIDVKELFANTMAVLQHPSTLYQYEVIEYDPEVHTYTFEQEIIDDIYRAIVKNELFLVYQPKVRADSFAVAGLEALLRWKHPTYGMISPGVFIPILEENGEIYAVTDWVIEETCKQISQWLLEDVPFHRVSINIPGSYVTSARLLSVLHSNLVKYGVHSQHIELEITETSVIHDMEKAIKAVGKFRELGLSVALDDFGTGLSSLSYLKEIPISTIKIDKSFIDDVPLSEKDSAVLRAIITLCDSLNLQVVIEGIETEAQLEFVCSLKENPLIQGYYFSRPLEQKEIVSWIESQALEQL